MLSSSMKLLGVGCLISSPLCWGISIRPAANTSSCPCLDWASVYTTHGVDCNPGLGGLAGGEFCNFMQHMHSNVCLESSFMHAMTLADSTCYVSAACATGGEGVVPKTCSPATSDTLLTQMSVKATTDLGTLNGADQGCLAAYGAIYVDKLYTEVEQKDIEYYKAQGNTYFIWSHRNHLGPRLHIRGAEVYKHTFNAKTQGYWDVACLAGCP